MNKRDGPKVQERTRDCVDCSFTLAVDSIDVRKILISVRFLFFLQVYQLPEFQCGEIFIGVLILSCLYHTNSRESCGKLEDR